MTMRHKAGSVGMLILFTIGSAGAANAQSTDLDDLVGARAGQAENAILSRGYVNVRSERGDDRSYAYWWNRDRRQCVVVTTMQGRYDAITPTTAPDCRQPVATTLPSYGARPIQSNRPLPPPRPSYDDGRPTTLPGSGSLEIGGRDVDLGLVCFGEGQRPTIESRTVWVWDSKRDHYDYGVVNQSGSKSVDATVMIQIWDGGGRIRLPKPLIPPINTRGDQLGWWNLDNVSSGPDQITASYRLNGLNKPRMTINRRSGTISIQGLGAYAFRGTCDLIDGDDHRRF